MNNFNTGLVVFIVVEQGINCGFISGEDYAEVVVELHCVNAAADHGFGSIVAAESAVVTRSIIPASLTSCL